MRVRVRHDRDPFRQAFLLLLVTAISAAFVAMIRRSSDDPAAAIFTGLSYLGSVGSRQAPWPQSARGGRDAVAVAGLAMAPLSAVLGAGANEVRRVTETMGHACSTSSICQASSTAVYGRSLATIASSRTGRNPQEGGRVRGRAKRLSLRGSLRHHARDGRLHLSLLCNRDPRQPTPTIVRQSDVNEAATCRFLRERRTGAERR